MCSGRCAARCVRPVSRPSTPCLSRSRAIPPAGGAAPWRARAVRSKVSASVTPPTSLSRPATTTSRSIVRRWRSRNSCAKACALDATLSARRRQRTVKRILSPALLLALPLLAAAARPPAPATSAAVPETAVLGRMSDAQRRAETDPPWLGKAVHDLAARGDADSLLAAALMTRDPAQRAQYAQAASLVAPRDALAWLQALEPDNAATWVPAAARADRAGDAQALDHALQKMADAPRFDPHAWRLAQRALRVRAAAPLPPGLSPDHRDDYLVDFFEGAMQAMQQQGPFERDTLALAAACGHPQAPRVRRQVCVRIGTSMENSGTLVAMLAGSRMVMRNSDNPAERDDARRRLRAVTWRVTQFPALAGSAYDDTALARAWLDALRTQRSEDAALIILLQSRHVPLQPPAGWQPPQAAAGQ